MAMVNTCLCLAYGLTTAVGDGRTLQGSSASSVQPLWKEFVTAAAQQQGISISEQRLDSVQIPDTKKELDLCTRNVSTAYKGILITNLLCWIT